MISLVVATGVFNMQSFNFAVREHLHNEVSGKGGVEGKSPVRWPSLSGTEGP